MGFYDGRHTQAADFELISQILRRMGHRFKQASDEEVANLKTQLQTAISEAFNGVSVDWDQLARELVQQFNKAREAGSNPLA